MFTTVADFRFPLVNPTWKGAHSGPSNAGPEKPKWRQMTSAGTGPAGMMEEEPSEESGLLLNSLHSYGEWPSWEAGLEKLLNLNKQQAKPVPSPTDACVPR